MQDRASTRSIAFIVGFSALLVAAMPVLSWADTIFANFGPSVSPCGTLTALNCINQNGYGITGATNQSIVVPGAEMIAASFTAGGNFTLSDVQLPLENSPIGPNSFNVYLTANNAGQPGTVLESWTNVPALAFAFPQVNALTLTSVLHPTLASGSTYWLAVGPGNTATWGTWLIEPFNTLTSTNWLFNTTPNASGIPNVTGPWTPGLGVLRTAFQIDGTPSSVSAVPEPETWILLGFGLVGLAAWRNLRMTLTI